jgi:hypothetical protein
VAFSCNMIDPNTKEPLKDGEIDLGHKPGQNGVKEMHRKKGSIRKEVIEAENDPSLYQLEDKKVIKVINMNKQVNKL